MPQDPFGDFVSSPSVRASELVRRIRATVREAENNNLSWHAVLDAIRAQGQHIWQALPLAERIRLVRWARPFWDVHRFRIAPQVKHVLDQAIDDGRLSVVAGSVQNVEANGTGWKVSLRQRGKPQPTETHFDAIVITTGPAHGGVLSSQPFLDGLQKAGVLTACETGLGIACDTKSVARTRDGEAAEGLYIAGPLARGTFGELMGVPQVTDHAFLWPTGLPKISHVTPSCNSAAVRADHRPRSLQRVWLRLRLRETRQKLLNMDYFWNIIPYKFYGQYSYW